MKKTLSRRSTAKSEITQDSSQGSRSSINPSVYRFQHLAAAGVGINRDPPDNVKAAIDAIVGREPTGERREILKRIAKEFHAHSGELVSASDSEDDSVREKAEWREELKPQPPQPLFSADFLRDPPPANEVSDEPRKRQQLPNDKSPLPNPSQAEPPDVSNTMTPPAEPPHISNTMTPPAEPPHEHKTMPPLACSSIKTPRPDVSIGIDMTGVTSRLASRLGTTEANALLPWLQNETKPSGKRTEPLLISVPALQASNLAFAFAAGEGKAYSTGRPVFEAQNQAAVAGACALKIQLDLQCLTRQAKSRAGTAEAASARALPLLFFSVCTEGPIHELMKTACLHSGRKCRKFAMGGLLDTVEQFLTAFDNVCAWGTGEFLDIVVESLEVVAGAATAK
ncbi:MAG: hypothetical protein LQ351_001177 [Letrouitia transgressa]|nr:MAG: hypothetical protein LQ351_001177 [Letrouitia transgressa]